MTASVALFLSCTLMYAQVDFKRQFDAFKTNASQVYCEFTDSVNAVFAEALKNQWERFMIDSAAARSRRPVPDTTSCRIVQDSTGSVQLPVSEVLRPAGSPAEMPETSLLSLRVHNQATKVIKSDFLGVQVPLNVPEAYGSFHPGSISEDGVSAFWRELSRHDYHITVQECMNCREEMGMNDWAVLKLAQSLANAVFPLDVYSERTVFMVFLLNQMNLKARIARCGGGLVCLFPSYQQIYGIQYIVIDGSPYYLIGSASGMSELFTYRTDFSKQSHPLDMGISRPLAIGDKIAIRDKESGVFGTTLHIPINHASLAFYYDYPQMDPIMYATAATGETFGQELTGVIRELVSDRPDELERLSAILQFVQNDFNYQVDEEQFGREKPFFCEENFLYEANDCEDRAVLLSFLVRNVLGLKTVLLDYPDHMTLAVDLPREIRGDYVVHDGRRYYVCDPSYIGAPIGKSMPKYMKESAKLWVIN